MRRTVRVGCVLVALCGFDWEESCSLLGRETLFAAALPVVVMSVDLLSMIVRAVSLVDAMTELTVEDRGLEKAL